MAKRPQPKAAQSAPKNTNSKTMTNRQLQAVIEAVNNLIVGKVALATQNAFALMTLGISVETAFKPAASLIEEYEKEIQAKINAISDRLKAEDENLTELDEETKKEIREIEAAHQSKMKELMNIEVDVEFVPITMNIFKNREGKEIDMELGSVHAFLPFMKG